MLIERPPSTLRRAICLVLYLTMIAGGGVPLYGLLVLGGSARLAGAGACLAGLGLYLLWIDFLAPQRKLDSETTSDGSGKP